MQVDRTEAVANAGTDHLVVLPGGSWALWRCVALRGAGFPAERVLRLADAVLAAEVERLLRAEDRLEAARRAALDAVHSALDELRNEGAWDRRDLKKPLFKAIRELNKARIPKPWGASAGEVLDALRAADLDLAARKATAEQAHADAVARASSELEQVAAWELFSEAVTWQNRRAVTTALEPLARSSGPETARHSQRRQHEEMVASYLQRYGTKNDTIGFFGPVGWAELDSIGQPVEQSPASTLLAERRVYFENWTVRALAEALEDELDLRPHLAPRLRSSCQREGTAVHTALGTVELTAAEVRVLDRCDGRTSARALAAELVSAPEAEVGSEAEVFEILGGLFRRRAVAWALTVPLVLHPDRALRQQLERVEEARLRSVALARLERLVRARDRVAEAAGDSRALQRAMRKLESTFAELTGKQGHRHHGQTYAARGLVYEDCRRGLDVRFGPQLLERLGPPLELVLRSVRWLVAELTKAVEERLREVHGQFRRAAGGAVGSYPFFGQVLATVFLKEERDACFARVEADFQRRWSELLGLEDGLGCGRLSYLTAALRERAKELFPGGGPAWSVAHQLSPDLLVAAAGNEAFRSGEFSLVLGEIHSSNTFLASCFVSQHPNPCELSSALERDAWGRLVVFPQMLAENWTQRMTPAIFPEAAYQYEFTDVLPESRTCRGLPAGSLVVVAENGRLVARTRDSRLSFDAIELFSNHLNQVCSAIASRPLRPAARTPRVTLDSVTICRESWRFDAADLDFFRLQDDAERYLEIRRWARRHELPRHCFYRVSSERKPVFLDLDSAVLVDLFVRQLRSADRKGDQATVVISEMLPRPDQLWLTDADGNLYTSELRMVAVQTAESGD